MDYELIKINRHNVNMLEDLARDARQDGFRFVKRTIDEWLLRINEFSKPGESMNGILVDGSIVAIGGLNVDPYLDDDSICRVRHVYVHRDHREKGYSKIILKRIIRDAKKKFRKIRLSTTSEIAAKLYQDLGFSEVKEHKATHAMNLKKNRTK